jgi:hypothetical protein
MNDEMKQDLKDQIEQMPHWFENVDADDLRREFPLDRRFWNPDPLETPDDYWDDEEEE